MWFKKFFEALTPEERRTFLTASAIFVISAVTLIGLGFVQVTRAVPASGGEFAEGAIGQPIYINPVIASNEMDKELVRLVFSNVSDLASKIEVSSDQRVWKMRLKENLRWHDGNKLTSDDVIFTVEKIQDPESASPLFASWQGITPQRLSEIELQLNLANPYAFFSDTLKNLYILPKHLFANVPPANWKLSDYNLKPIGSGPYEFSSYEKRSDGFIYSYHLQSWDKYFGDKSLIQNLDFQFFTATDDLIKAFNAGEINGASGIEPADLVQIKRPYEAVPFRLPNYYAVFFNQSKSLPLKDLAARKALNYAVNKENLINEVLGGRGKPAIEPIPEGAEYFNPEIGAATTSLDLASATLDNAGWKTSENGMREKKVQNVKIPLELNLAVPRVDFLLKTADLLKQSWEKVGFRINIIPQSTDEIAGNTIKNRDYEMLIFGNVLGRSSDLFSFWHSSQRFYPFYNLALYNNKKADALIESIRRNTDSPLIQSQFDQLQALITNDYPAVFLYSPDYLYVASKNLHGVDGGFVAEPADIFATANKWYLKTARVLK
jgi:peptide/nickel transport system substrate-binding protein